jgi:putative membrane protein
MDGQPRPARRYDGPGAPRPASREAAVNEFLVRLIVNAVALVAAVRIVPDVVFLGTWWQLGAVAVIFGVINSYLRPVVKVLSLPLNLVALGLVGFAINTGLLLLLAFVSDQFDLGFRIAGWPPGSFDLDVIVAAFFASLVISVVSALIGFVRLAVPRL